MPSLPWGLKLIILFHRFCQAHLFWGALSNWLLFCFKRSLKKPNRGVLGPYIIVTLVIPLNIYTAFLLMGQLMSVTVVGDAIIARGVLGRRRESYYLKKSKIN